MYKAKNMNIILHFKGSVSFKILFFKIKDKNLLINKFFTESKNHFFFFLSYKPLFFQTQPPYIITLHNPWLPYTEIIKMRIS